MEHYWFAVFNNVYIIIKMGATLKETKNIYILLSQKSTNGCYIIYTSAQKWNTTAFLFLEMSIIWSKWVLLLNRQTNTFYYAKTSQMGAILCMQEPRNGTLLFYCFLRYVYIIIKVGATIKQTINVNILFSQKIKNGCYIMYIRDHKWNTTDSLFLRMSIL